MTSLPQVFHKVNMKVTANAQGSTQSGWIQRDTEAIRHKLTELGWSRRDTDTDAAAGGREIQREIHTVRW